MKLSCWPINCFQVSGLETNINFLLTLSRHPEFRKGNVHTNFIPNYESELFAKKARNNSSVGFAVLAQVFSEEVHNLKTSEANDPFVRQGSFRINHSLTRNLSYNLDEKTKCDAQVEFLRKNKFKVSYVFESPEGKSNAQEFLLEGKYAQGENDLLIECLIDGQVCSSHLLLRSKILVFDFLIFSSF